MLNLELPPAAHFLSMKHVFEEAISLQDHREFARCFGDDIMKADHQISPAPFSCALYEEETDQVFRVHCPARCASLAMWNYATQKSGRVICRNHVIMHIFFDKIKSLTLGYNGSEDELLFRFNRPGTDDPEVLNKIVCCFYRKADMRTAEQSPGVTPPVDKMISFGDFSDEFEDLEENLKILDLTESDRRPFTEKLNAVFVRGDGCYSFHFPEQSISFAVATVLLHLNASNSRYMDLFYPTLWSGPYQGIELDENGRNVTTAMTAFLIRLENFFGRVAAKYPHLKMGSVDPAHRDAQHNVICCSEDF